VFRRPRGARKAVVAVIAAACLGGMAAAGFAGPPSAATAHGAVSLSAAQVSVAKAPPPVESIDCRHLKCVALTFDDGPGVSTGELLRVLSRAHVHATFFMLGIQVHAYPTLAKQVAAAGHEIADHTWDHKDLTQMSERKVKAEIARARAMILKVTGRAPQLFRPPYGSTTPEVARLAGALGMPEVLWDVDTDDWLYRHAPVVQANAVNAAFPGAIILMHDIYPSTVAAVPGIIKQLRAQGYTLVTVSQLFGTMKPGTEYFGSPKSASKPLLSAGPARHRKH
jgi:peptidoglycan/xylan/chitin deacetylase (PgdA/CDA1 family)